MQQDCRYLQKKEASKKDKGKNEANEQRREETEPKSDPEHRHERGLSREWKNGKKNLKTKSAKTNGKK